MMVASSRVAAPFRSCGQPNICRVSNIASGRHLLTNHPVVFLQVTARVHQITQIHLGLQAECIVGEHLNVDRCPRQLHIVNASLVHLYICSCLALTAVGRFIWTSYELNRCIFGSTEPHFFRSDKFTMMDDLVTIQCTPYPLLYHSTCRSCFHSPFTTI